MISKLDSKTIDRIANHFNKKDIGFVCAMIDETGKCIVQMQGQPFQINVLLITLLKTGLERGAVRTDLLRKLLDTDLGEQDVPNDGD